MYMDGLASGVTYVFTVSSLTFDGRIAMSAVPDMVTQPILYDDASSFVSPPRLVRHESNDHFSVEWTEYISLPASSRGIAVVIDQGTPWEKIFDRAI